MNFRKIVQNYKRQPCERGYCNYAEETLQTAFSSMRNEKYSMRKASKTNNIAHGTLQNKTNNQHQNKKNKKKKKR